MSQNPTDPQPAPQASDGPNIAVLVQDDLAARFRFGLEKYGDPLRPFNSRDALSDAYQEALDQVLYLRQAIYERDCAPERLSVAFRGMEALESEIGRLSRIFLNLARDVADHDGRVEALESRLAEQESDGK